MIFGFPIRDFVTLAIVATLIVATILSWCAALGYFAVRLVGMALAAAELERFWMRQGRAGRGFRG